MKTAKTSLKFSAFAISILLLASAFAVAASAESAVVSPALGVISRDVSVTVTGMGSGDAAFSAEDFDFTLGLPVKKVTVLTLPDASSGTLLLDGKPVVVNQKISRRSLGKLSFHPATPTAEASFYVTANDSYATECFVRVIESVNLAPTVSDEATKLYIETMKGAVVYGSVTVRDPEDGSFELIVTDQPKKGSVSVSKDAPGEFTYTPSEGKSGSDRFSLRARDEYGNWSEEIAVSVRINKNKSGVEYSDLAGQEAYSAAVKMTDAGVMSGKYVDGKALFYPDRGVTREEFVTMLMKTIGLRDIPEISEAAFADDGEFSPEARNYIRAAKKLGFVSGAAGDDGSLRFSPDAVVTRAEVAVILQNVIGVKVDPSVPVFADNDSIPAWAAEAVLAMRQLGIMNGGADGSFSPSASITRAEVASILSSVYDMVE